MLPITHGAVTCNHQ